MIHRIALCCSAAMLFALTQGATAQAATTDASQPPTSSTSLLSRLAKVVPDPTVDDLGWG
ncbi:hypothetical protein ACFTWS_18980 [Streptomyces sp. NPDC057027]|uniref:hypothetical protein n=1 Tax=Streptomyces sp. NPDC057027 TaxID=3346004 RepID=UPI00363FEC14